MLKKGILLVNIGSPQSYQVADVKKYLRRFLMDGNVIDIAAPLRWLLVNGIIVPFRSGKSAANYKKIWTDQGSPLICYSENFRQELQKALGDDYVVKTGMNYSSPDIQESLLSFSRIVSEVVVAPMFPQYANATTGSILQRVGEVLSQFPISLSVKVLPAFFKEKAYIDNQARLARESLHGKTVEHYVFSFHGLPQSQIERNHQRQGSAACCEMQSQDEMNCYQAQCLTTAGLLAQSLNLSKNQWTLAFQSRLGKAKWLEPSTDQVLAELAQKNIRNVAVLCPAFVADCIETLEEIGMGARHDFIQAGGQDLHLVPCLNADREWARDFADLCRRL